MIFEMLKQYVFPLFFVFWILFFSGSVWAKIVSVQSIETPNHLDSPISISFLTGILPADTYYNYSSLGLGVNRSLNELWSWTVVEYHGVFSSASDSADYIKNKFSQFPDKSNRLKNMYSTGIMFSPILLKHVSSPSRSLSRFDALQFENRWQPKTLWADMALTLNYGKANFDTFKNVDLFSYGILFRFYEKNQWSFQLEFKNIAFVQSELSNQMYISFGFSKYFDWFRSASKTENENLKPGI